MDSKHKSKATLPPAANWFSSNILSAGPGGWVCWGAKNNLVLLNDSDANEYPNVITHNDAHADKSKVTAVAWCPDSNGVGKDKVTLASGADDGILRTWRHNPDTCTLTQVGHVSTETGRVTCMSWSRADPALLVAGTESGTVVNVLDMISGQTRTCNFGKQLVFSVSCHPQKPEIVAIGCKLGLVLIVNIDGTGRIHQRMRGHDEDVYGVSWSPCQGISIGDQSFEEWLLVSSSRDKTLRVWSEKEGRSVHMIRIPAPDRRQGGKDAAWISCHWQSPSIILSSGVSGELLAWHLDKPAKKGGSEWFVVTREHFKNLFSIGVSDSGKVYTVGQDRLMVVSDPVSRTKVYSLPCFAGFVYTIASNPIEPSTLAIGAGDGLIRIWRTGDTRDKFSIRTVQVKQAKVMSLAWHSTKEGLLAYGTDEGRVCWVDVLANARSPTISQYQHRAGVYCVTWLDTCTLVTCGDGKLVKHNTNTSKGEELLLQGASGGSNTNKSQVVVYDRGEIKLFLVGYEDGSIHIFNYDDSKNESPLTLIANIKSQTKLIQSLALHHQYNADGDQAKFSNYLASANNEFPVHLFDLTTVLEQREVSSPHILVTPHVTLNGHQQRVIEVAWSPHDDHLLCSVSYDFSAQVWDVSSGTPLHNFSGHNGRVMCCSWHPTLSLVMSGAEDGTLHLWDPKEQSRNLPIERKKERKLKKTQDNTPLDSSNAKSSGKDVKDMSFDELLAFHKSEQTSKTKDIANEDKEGLDTKLDDLSVEKPRQILKPSSNRERKVKTVNKKLYFPVSSNAEIKSKNQAAEDCEAILAYNMKLEKSDNVESEKDGISEIADSMENKLVLTESKSLSDKIHLGFFSSKEAMYDLLEKEKLEQVDDFEAKTVISLWTGDIDEVIEAAISEARVTERLVSHAAGVSVVLWRRATECLGRQLVRDGEILRGAEYLVSSGHLVDAVQVLSRHGHHRAAVAVARVRLPRDCELMKNVFRAWAIQSQNDGNYGLAAKCWLSARFGSEAAECLTKIGDRKSVRMAAVVTNDADKRMVYSKQCLVECCLAGDGELAKVLIQDHPEKLSWSLPLCTTISYLQKISKQKCSDETSDKPLLQAIKMENKDYSWTDENRNNISQFVSSINHPDDLRQTLIKCAFELTLAMFDSSSNQQRSLGHVAKCLHFLSSWPDTCRRVISQLFPSGVGTAPDVGKAVLDQTLDWQCNWLEVRSIQATSASVSIKHWRDQKSLQVSEDDLTDAADGIMLDDVIKRQKLEAEITEAEAAIKKFDSVDKESNKNEQEDTINQRGDSTIDKSEENSKVDLTPSLSGMQTLSLSSEGEWTSSGVSDALPMPQSSSLRDNEDSLPPPPPPCRPFHDRFLAGRSSTVEAVKELQKLKWTKDRTTAAVASSPFPDLSESCKDLVMVLVDRGIGAKSDSNFTNDQDEELDLRRRVARWGYYHGRRDYQGFFMQYS